MLIAPARAFSIILDNVRPSTAARTDLKNSLGLVLARPIRADRDMPPTDRSAMDGYAVRFADLDKPPCQLRLVGEVAAGGANRPRVQPGTCVGILTGAAVPPGADTVVMVEDTVETDGVVRFRTKTPRGENIRRRGEEVRRGQVVLERGTVLGPAQIGVCASVGKAAVSAYSRPRVAVLCTGRELRTTDQRVGRHQLRDSNGPALVAALGRGGVRKVHHRLVTDDPKLLTRKLASAVARHDIVLLTGGVSVGKYDYVPHVVEAIGAKVRFHGVAMKPGKPQLYATLSGNRHIFGLPGNPLSVLTGFHQFVLPAIRRFSGADVEACSRSFRVRLGAPARSRGDRTSFVLVRLTRCAEGLTARPIKSVGSADLIAGAQADGVIAIGPNTPKIPAGEMVTFTSWRPCS